MFGFLQVALGLTLFFLGSRLLPSGQAALISTLETPLMPFWIWVGFGELSHAAGPRRRRPGDGRRHCRHHRRYPDAAAVKLTAREPLSSVIEVLYAASIWAM